LATDSVEREKLVRDLGKVLVKMNVIQFGTFKLTSGKLKLLLY